MVITLDELFAVVLERSKLDVDISYTARLLAEGNSKIAKKVGEEAVETAIAATLNNKEQVINESCDLLFHLLILWANQGVTPQEVITEFIKRKNNPELEKTSLDKKLKKEERHV